MLDLHYPESSINFYSIIVLPLGGASAKKVVVKIGVDETLVLQVRYRVIS